MQNVVFERDLDRSLVRLRRERALIDQVIGALTRYRELSSQLPQRCRRRAAGPNLAPNAALPTTKSA